MRRGLIAAFLAALACAPAAQALPEPPAEHSDNVSWLATLDEPQGISARFRGSEMYVSSSRGLSVYDVSRPQTPQKIGSLALPHFENEDVDLGGDVLLISNDPSEGKGILYVISIKDPRNPAILSTFDTGTIFGSEGEVFFGTPTRGTGHTASCIQGCRYAYLAGTASGIDIVDLTDPRAPKFAGNFRAEEATGGLASHDVQVDSEGLAWVVGGGGTASYDTTDPRKPKLVHRTNEQGKSVYGVEPTDGKALNDFIHHNSLRLNNSSIVTAPPGSDPAAESSVVVVTEEDYNRPTCDGAGQVETWQIGEDRVMRPLDDYVVPIDPSKASLCSAHYFDERSGLLAQGWYEAGTRFLDVSNPSDIRPVGYWVPAKNMTWSVYYPPTDPAGEIVYSLDFARGIDVLRIARAGQPAARVEPPPSSSGSGGGARPNVRVAIDDRVESVRRGRRLLYRLTVTNTSSTRAQAVEASATLPRALGRVRGGRPSRGVVSFGTKYVNPGRTRTFLFSAQAGRRAKGKVVEVSARVSARDDLDPRDNYAVDRDRLLAAKGKAKRTRKAAAGGGSASGAGSGGSAASAGSGTYDAGDPANARHEARIAASTSSMPTEEPLALPVASERAWVGTFGKLCRSPLG
jgi:hypothetical protein